LGILRLPGEYDSAGYLELAAMARRHDLRTRPRRRRTDFPRRAWFSSLCPSAASPLCSSLCCVRPRRLPSFTSRLTMVCSHLVLQMFDHMPKPCPVQVLSNFAYFLPSSTPYILKPIVGSMALPNQLWLITWARQFHASVHQLCCLQSLHGHSNKPIPYICS
jgi:hypothetical protein